MSVNLRLSRRRMSFNSVIRNLVLRRIIVNYSRSIRNAFQFRYTEFGLETIADNSIEARHIHALSIPLYGIWS